MTEENLNESNQFLNQLIANFLLEQEQHGPKDPESLIAQYPEHEQELRQYFADDLQMQRAFRAADLSDLDEDDEDSHAELHPPRSLIGQRFGDYQILEELGIGGMGVVYKAKQISISRVVALKMIRAGSLATPQDVQRFYDEARAQARLCHPGIVAVHDVGSIEGQHYFTMDYVPGGSLTRLQRDEAVSSRRAAKLVRRMAESMHYAHENRVIHRDLKPSNVLLDSRGAPRITDFGLAKLKFSEDETRQQTKTATGQILGTAGYMSPEQAEGKKDVAHPSDIYSLGAVLYALLTGRAPFVGETIASTLLQVVHADPVSPRAFNPNVPPDLETICMKCLEKDHTRRYASAQDLADELKRFLKREPILARPVSSIERGMRWKSRNPGIFRLLMLTVGVVVAGVSVSGVFAYRSIQLSRELHTLNGAAAELNDDLRVAGQTLREKEDENSQLQSRLTDSHKELERRVLQSDIERARVALNSDLPGQSVKPWTAVERYSNGLQYSQMTEEDRLQLRDVAVSSQLLPDLRYLSTWEGELTASTDVVISPDFEWLAFGLPADGRILVRRRSSEIADRMEIESPVSANRSYFGFSNDVKWLSSFDYSTKAVRFLDLQNGVDRHQYQVVDVANWRAVSFHPVDAVAVIGQTSGALLQLNLTTGESQVLVNETVPVLSVRHNPDGEKIAYCLADGTVCIRSSQLESAQIQNSEPQSSVEPQVVSQRWSVTPGSKTISWSPESDVLAVGEQNRVKLYRLDADSNSRMDSNVLLTGHEAEIIEIAWNPVSPILATSGHDGCSKIWDAVSGEMLVQVSGRIRGFSEDGQQIAVHQSEVLKFYELVPVTAVARVEHNTDFSVVAAHPELHLASVAHENGVSLVNTANGKVLSHLPLEKTQSVCFNPADQSLIVSCESGLWRWPVVPTSVPAGVMLRVGPPQQIGPEKISAGLIRISRDSQRLLYRDNRSNEASVFDLTVSDPPVRLEGVALSIVDISPDGTLVVGGDQYSRELQVWETSTGKVMKTLPFEDGFPYVRFSHNGQWLAANGLTSVAVWNVDDWSQKFTKPLDCHGPAGLAFSRDDSTLAVGRWGKSLQLLSVESGALLATLNSPTLPTTLRDLVITNDGQQLYGVADQDGVYSVNLGEVRTRLASVGLDWTTSPLPPAASPSWSTVEVIVNIDWGDLGVKLTTSKD